MAESLDILLDNAALTARTAELARRIEEDYEGEPLLLVGILKGSLHFLSDLARHVRLDTRVDFIQASSYHGGKETTGNVQIRKDLDVDIAGLNVLLVEDIVDTGTTIAHLREILEVRRPKTLRLASLLRKTEINAGRTRVDYLGFDIPNHFVVGYGLDYEERFRNLPYIAVLRES